jgi:hypothetical protein
MAGDFQHLQPLNQKIAAQQNYEPSESIRHDRWINQTRAEPVLARLSDLLSYPPQSRMPDSLRVGDYCRLTDESGTIEDNGLSSTRLRALDRTVASIPNS